MVFLRSTPGHSGAICRAYPAACVSNLINPTSNHSYEVMGNLFEAAATVFPDAYLHLGGDEVKAAKWAADPQISSWMTSHGMNSTSALYAYYEATIQELARNQNKTVVNWVEVFDMFGAELDQQTIVHVWKSRDDLQRVLQAGFRAILSDSAQWYLTGPHTSHTWQSMCASVATWPLDARCPLPASLPRFDERSSDYPSSSRTCCSD